MDIVVSDQLDTSFDIVARQDAADTEIKALRGDVDEVKSRLDRVSRAAQRPALASEASPEVKGFVDGYLRSGRTTELKSLTQGVPADGGFAVPREIDAMIARALTSISPIRSIAQVVQTGTSGYRKLFVILLALFLRACTERRANNARAALLEYHFRWPAA